MTTMKNEHEPTNVIFQTTWRCAELTCLAPEVQTMVRSAREALDPTGFREHLPLGWTEIDGRTYCHRHQVDVTVRVHSRKDECANSCVEDLGYAPIR